MIELDFFSNIAPFFVALAVLIALKFKLWRDVETVNWLQHICGLILGPLIIFSVFLLYILLGKVDAGSLGLSIFILMFYLALVTPVFALIVLLTKTKSFILLVAIALGTNLLYLFGQYLTSNSPDRAERFLDFEIVSVLAVNGIILATSYWAYIKNWPRIDIQSKIGGNE